MRLPAVLLVSVLLFSVSACGSDRAGDGPDETRERTDVGAPASAGQEVRSDKLTKEDARVRSWLYEIGLSAQNWKRQQEGLARYASGNALEDVENVDSYDGVSWQELVSGSALTSEGRVASEDRHIDDQLPKAFEATIESRTPLVIRAEATESGKVFTVTVDGVEAHNVSLKRTE